MLRISVHRVTKGRSYYFSDITLYRRHFDKIWECTVICKYEVFLLDANIFISFLDSFQHGVRILMHQAGSKLGTVL